MLLNYHGKLTFIASIQENPFTAEARRTEKTRREERRRSVLSLPSFCSAFSPCPPCLCGEWVFLTVLAWDHETTENNERLALLAVKDIFRSIKI